MDKNNLLNLMVGHHALLEALFALFDDEIREKSPHAVKSLAELEWEIQKHFFVEENAIFNLPQIKAIKVYDMVLHLKAEHTEMLGYLRKFSENFSEIKSEDIEKLAGLLATHREMEEKELYPKLDKELPEEQKRQAILRINEFPNKTK